MYGGSLFLFFNAVSWLWDITYYIAEVQENWTEEISVFRGEPEFTSAEMQKQECLLLHVGITHRFADFSR